MEINNYSQCPKINSLIFMDVEYDQAFAIYYYTFVDEMPTPDSCYKVSGGGTWAKTSNDKYSVHIEYFEENDPYNIGTETIYYEAFFPAPDSLLLHNLNKLEQHQTEMEGLEDYYVVYTLDIGGIPSNYPPWL